MRNEKVNLTTYKQMFEALSTALYYDQDRKRYHGLSTALIGKKLAEKTGLADPSRLFYTGLIHDLGGVGLKHHIVHIALAGSNQRKKFSSSEMKQAKRHGPLGAERLKNYEGFKWAIPLIQDHHERYDGSGFPVGKNGDKVSTEAGLLAAADMLDIYLYSLGEQFESTSGAERVDGFSDFLGEHGGFREEVGNAVLDLAGREDFARALESITSLEKMVEEEMERLSPPGGIHLEGIVELLGTVVDIKSNYTEDHSSRVATLGEKVGRKLGMSEQELSDYRYAAYLHDLGKVGINRKIITKPESLTEEEYEQIKKHPNYSRQILSEIGELEEVARIAGQHHERYDGNGYPKGLEGKQIKPEARIITVIDAWDAMRTDRPYQKALNKEEAIKELRENAGSQFDPQIVDILAGMIEEGEVELYRSEGGE